MKILIIEPFFGGSHESWAKGFKASSRHVIEMLTLEGRTWKWRMRGGAVTLARLYLEGGYSPDLILATDMLDLSTFTSLTRDLTAEIPIAVYFHENQLTYPWSPNEKKSKEGRREFGFINFTTALTAKKLFFNSAYHMEAFLSDLSVFLEGFPDYNERESIELIREKSEVLYLGMDFKKLDKAAATREEVKEQSAPLILWNHRWEYDKEPAEFFRALYLLMDKGLAFDVAILGEHFTNIPEVFKEARERLGERVVHFGYAKEYAEYARLLTSADILPVTSSHDFFGCSVVEAIYAGALPILPKRLAYPEHIPQAFHDDIFYDGFYDLLSRLEEAIIQAEKGETPSNDALKEHVARYSWQRMAPLYDEAMEDIVDS
jgi:glycosyltransferase involved in cell wall biosynthesis